MSSSSSPSSGSTSTPGSRSVTPSAAARRPAASSSGARGSPGVAIDDLLARADDLRERLAGVVDPLREAGQRAAAVDEQPRDRGRARLQRLVGRVGDLVAQAGADREAGDDEQHRHREREGARDAEPDAGGEAAHAGSRR